MASLTMMASFVGGVTAVKRPWNSHRRSLSVPKAQNQDTTKKTTNDVNGDDNNININHNINGRRAVMFAAAAAAIGAAGSRPAAMADEPKRGTPEARKIYAPICATMPTAKICHK